MTDEDTIGYLLDLLDPDERAAVEAHLAADPAAAAHAERLRAALSPLEADRDDPSPPSGLAVRTVGRVAEYLVEHEPRRTKEPLSVEDIAVQVGGSGRATGPGPRSFPVTDEPEPRSVGGRFRFDLVVAAGIGLVAVGLALSAVNRVRHQHDVAACQANLMTLHQGLSGYADTHTGRFPQVGGGKYPTADSFVAALTDAGQCPPHFRPSCPAAPAPGPVTPVNYAYALGYQAPSGGVVGPWRSSAPGDENDLIAISADYPAATGTGPDGCDAGPTSPHRWGHNVLYVGGAVRFATSPTVGINGDHIYRNHHGRVAAGVDRTDTVLGLAGDRP